MKIATWNVNSLRIRLPQVLQWLTEHQPDVLTLQETKTPDDLFPQEEINALGYQISFNGQKTFNGVAILSRHEIKDVIKDFPTYNDPLRRVLAATIKDVRVINLYIPNGQAITSEKYIYKMEWLSHLHKFLEKEKSQHKKIIVLGDFNIAPEEIDVHDATLLQDQITFSEKEREALKNIFNLGFKDCFRLHSQEKEFTWWDYRLNSFKRNMGLRIDHILANEGFPPAKCYIDKNPRSHERPSDHAIVVAEF